MRLVIALCAVSLGLPGCGRAAVNSSTSFTDGASSPSSSTKSAVAAPASAAPEWLKPRLASGPEQHWRANCPKQVASATCDLSDLPGKQPASPPAPWKAVKMFREGDNAASIFCQLAVQLPEGWFTGSGPACESSRMASEQWSDASISFEDLVPGNAPELIVRASWTGTFNGDDGATETAEQHWMICGLGDLGPSCTPVIAVSQREQRWPPSGDADSSDDDDADADEIDRDHAAPTVAEWKIDAKLEGQVLVFSNPTGKRPENNLHHYAEPGRYRLVFE